MIVPLVVTSVRRARFDLERELVERTVNVCAILIEELETVTE